MYIVVYIQPHVFRDSRFHTLTTPPPPIFKQVITTHKISYIDNMKTILDGFIYGYINMREREMQIDQNYERSTASGLF